MPLQSQPALVSTHARLPGCTHSHTTRHLTARHSGRPLVGWSVSARRQIPRLSNGTLTQTSPDPASITPLERSTAMRPAYTCMRLPLLYLTLLLGLIVLAGPSGCGQASSGDPSNVEPRASVGGPSGSLTGSTEGGGQPQARAGPAANEPARQAPTQTSSLGPTAQHASTPGALITDASRATSPTHDARAQTAAAPADTPHPDEQTTAERAQREARQMWFAEVREHPDVTVRLQALELWAQQPGDALDPVTYALVDGDEQVRARAQELWWSSSSRETATSRPVQEEGPGGQAER